MATRQRAALLSVSDKEGTRIVERAQVLHQEFGFLLYGSRGTVAALKAAGIPATDVAEIVGDPMFGHLVVTLSREVHAGLLAATAEHFAELERLGLPHFDLVCVDLYPLDAAIAAEGATEQSVIDNTDIGGPTMLRAGAKGRRIVISSSDQWDSVLDWLRAGEPDSARFRRQLAAKAEMTAAHYALLSARYLSEGEIDGMIGFQIAECKAENGHQSPAGVFQVLGSENDSLAEYRFVQVAGPNPGYNNRRDASRLQTTLTRLAANFEVNFSEHPYLAAAAKHGNPCGASYADDPLTAIRRTVEGDPLAIFGGVVMVNFVITEELAHELLFHVSDGRRFLVGVVAPGFTDEAITLLKGKSDRCFLFVNEALGQLGVASLDQQPIYRPGRGVFLRQGAYTKIVRWDESEVISTTGELPSKAVLRDMSLAEEVCATSNSNTISVTLDGTLLGNGTGQQDRRAACRVSVTKANPVDDEGNVTVRSEGAVAAGDSFFSHKDAVEVLVDAGVQYIVATSGSKIGDEPVSAFVRESGVTLLWQPDDEARLFFGH